MGVDWTQFGDHFTIYTCIESLCCTPKTENVVCQYFSIITTKKNHQKNK